MTITIQKQKVTSPFQNASQQIQNLCLCFFEFFTMVSQKKLFVIQKNKTTKTKPSIKEQLKFWCVKMYPCFSVVDVFVHISSFPGITRLKLILYSRNPNWQLKICATFVIFNVIFMSRSIVSIRFFTFYNDKAILLTSIVNIDKVCFYWSSNCKSWSTFIPLRYQCVTATLDF